jgi:putative ATP-dependent endonuclease of OLD family
MRISRVAVSNHNRVADFDVEVREHAVFVGPNAVGKSTVLRLLDCALGASWSHLAASLDASQLRDETKPMVVEVRLEDLDADDRAHFADKVEVGTGAASGSAWLTIRLRASLSPVDPERLDFDRSFVKPKVDDAPVNRDDLRQIGWVFLPASRSPDRELGSGRSSAVRSLLRAVSLDPGEAKAIEDAVAALSTALEVAPSLESVRESLAGELSALFPEPIDKADIAIDLPSSSTDDPLGDVDVQLDRGGRRTPLSAQSDGLRSLSVVAVQLLARRSARILAIDEPEIHLHPRGQANLGRLLASAPGQRLVATHAPAVLARFNPTHAVAVTAGGARQLSGAAFAGDPKRYHHWWVDSALEPLTADRIVFVEGISDRIIACAVADLLGHQLDRCGVSVVSLNGAGNFVPAIRMFGPTGFGIRLLGLVDKNEEKFPARALGVKEADLATNDVFTCNSDLEEECTAALGVVDTVGLLTRSGLFTEAAILSATGAASVGALSVADLAAFLRKNKVEAAAALAEGMNATQAKKLTTVKDLLDRAVGP